MVDCLSNNAHELSSHQLYQIGLTVMAKRQTDNNYFLFRDPDIFQMGKNSGVRQIISIKVKIMNNSYQTNNQAEIQNPSYPRRRRTPSRYYTNIRQLTKLHTKSSKKQKSQSPMEEESPQNFQGSADRTNGIQCILPGKMRKIKLSVIIRKQPKAKPKPKKIVSSIQLAPPEKKQKDPPKKNCLLDTLLQVVQKIQDDQNQNSKQEDHQKSTGNNIGQQDYRRQYKMRKEKEEEEKYLRYYEKYQGIVQRLDDLERQLVFI